MKDNKKHLTEINKKSKFDDNNIIPNEPVIQHHSFNCCRCGFKNAFIKPEKFVDYREAFEVERKHRRDLIHELNELMAYAEYNYGINPGKEMLVESLLKLREKYES